MNEHIRYTLSKDNKLVAIEELDREPITINEYTCELAIKNIKKYKSRWAFESYYKAHLNKYETALNYLQQK